MLMTTVSGVALGLATQGTVQSDDVDYWIVPDDNGKSTAALAVGGAQLGDVHSTAAQLQTDERIEFATPVQLRVVNLQNKATGTEEYVLAIGVIPQHESNSIAGLPLRGMTPGDPYYANGSYNGQWTGEAILSDAAAELLGVSRNDELTIRSGGTTRELQALNVSQADLSSGAGPIPVVVLHLSELQAVAGGTDADLADQILVSTDDARLKPHLEQLVPGTTVVSRSGVSSPDLSTSDLSLAVGLTAFVTAIVVGVLFVGTMMGLEVMADRNELAVLAAIGYSSRSRAVLVLTETVTVSLVGGIVGVGLGGLGMVLFNQFATQYFGVESVAAFSPFLLLYGVLVALLIGLIAAPYPILVSQRTSVSEVLG
ncbi:ABC transporter permease [Halogranum rubrum]|nr:ABC transporter permease [Halogranum rubrum]